MAKYITVYAYSKKHGLSNDTVMRWVKKGKLPHKVKIEPKKVILIKEDEPFKK